MTLSSGHHISRETLINWSASGGARQQHASAHSSMGVTVDKLWFLQEKGLKETKDLGPELRRAVMLKRG